MKPKIKIRPEHHTDHNAVFELIEKAFANVEFSDHKEQYLVERLRSNTEVYIPELSMVATIDNKVVGHIILTRISIVNNETSVTSLALAPVSVLPKHQKNGIGSLLINSAHTKASELGYQSVVLIGHEDYYPRFGYKEAAEYGITFPFEVPSKNAMALELSSGALNGINGKVQYPPEFLS